MTMVMMKRTLVLMTLLAITSAHQIKLGSNCNIGQGLSNFDPVKFNGTWYVIKKMVTSSKCLSAVFDWQAADDTFKVTEVRTPVTDFIPFRATVTNEGVLTVDPNNPSSMKLEWDGNLLNSVVTTNFIVVDTDYDNYAVDFECQSFAFWRRISATIYSRNATMDSDLLTQLENKLKSDFSIDLDRLSSIDQSSCFDPSTVDYNVKIDENGLSFLGLLGDQQLLELDSEQEVKDYLKLPQPQN